MEAQETILVGRLPEVGAHSEPSLLKRMTNVFFSPGRAFQGAFSVRSWWVPTLITILFSYSFSGLTVHKLGLPQIVQTAITSDAQLESRVNEATDDVKMQIYSQIQTTFKVSMIATPLLVLGFNLVIAGVLLGSFNSVLGAKVSRAE